MLWYIIGYFCIVILFQIVVVTTSYIDDDFWTDNLGINNEPLFLLCFGWILIVPFILIVIAIDLLSKYLANKIKNYVHKNHK